MYCAFMGVEPVRRLIEKWARYVFSLFQVQNLVIVYNELDDYSIAEPLLLYVHAYMFLCTLTFILSKKGKRRR